jgi:hypothetical protein
MGMTHDKDVTIITAFVFIMEAIQSPHGQEYAQVAGVSFLERLFEIVWGSDLAGVEWLAFVF